jgi:hypothetical protein
LSVIKKTKSYDSQNKETDISRQFDDGTRDLLQKPKGLEEGGSHTGFDKDGKLTFSYSRSVYDTSAISLENLEAHKIDEATKRSLEAEAHASKASKLKEERLTEEAKNESIQAAKLNRQSEGLIQESNDIRARREVEASKQRQRSKDLDRDR